MSYPHVVRGYSEFFTSGFKAVTNRSHHQQTASGSHHQHASKPPLVVEPPSQPKPNVPPKSRRTLSDLTHRRRPASMIVSSTEPKIPSESPASRQQEKPPRSSRASIVSAFSSRLFERKVSTSSKSANTVDSTSHSLLSGSSSFSATDSAGLPEVWITAGGPYTPSAPNGSPAHFQPMDPFTAAPNARSIFVESWPSNENSPASSLQVTPLPPSPSAASLSISLPSTGGSGPATKRESFLSLTTSTSSNRSSSVFFVHRDRSDRPTSVQTMPLPSNSRRSSYQHWTQQHAQSPSTPSERDNFFLIREEEGALCSPATCRVTHESDLEWSADDAPAKIDWRQFHLELLTDDA